MIKVKHFIKHLDGISQADWDSLFELLPEIKSTKIFGELIEPKKQENGSYTFPYWNSASIVDRTLDRIDDLDLTPNFDWMHWNEGVEILSTENFNYSTLDKITLCKLLTCIIRLERFCDGNIVHKFEDRTVEKILENLQVKLSNSNKYEKSQNFFLTFFRFIKSKNE